MPWSIKAQLRIKTITLWLERPAGREKLFVASLWDLPQNQMSLEASITADFFKQRSRCKKNFKLPVNIVSRYISEYFLLQATRSHCIPQHSLHGRCKRGAHPAPFWGIHAQVTQPTLLLQQPGSATQLEEQNYLASQRPVNVRQPSGEALPRATWSFVWTLLHLHCCWWGTWNLEGRVLALWLQKPPVPYFQLAIHVK